MMCEDNETCYGREEAAMESAARVLRERLHSLEEAVDRVVGDIMTRSNTEGRQPEPYLDTPRDHITCAAERIDICTKILHTLHERICAEMGAIKLIR